MRNRENLIYISDLGASVSSLRLFHLSPRGHNFNRAQKKSIAAHILLCRNSVFYRRESDFYYFNGAYKQKLVRMYGNSTRNRILDSLYFGLYVADTVILQNNPDRLSVSQKARKISELRPIQTDEINKNIFEISIAILHNIGYNKANNELRRFKYENR